MRVEYFGPYNNDDGSYSHTVFEIEDGCERVLVASPEYTRGSKARVWGFMPGDRQVEGRILHHNPAAVIIG